MLDSVLALYLVKFILLFNLYWLGQQALASHWLEEFANAKPTFFINDQSYAAPISKTPAVSQWTISLSNYILNVISNICKIGGKITPRNFYIFKYKIGGATEKFKSLARPLLMPSYPLLQTFWNLSCDTDFLNYEWKIIARILQLSYTV